MVRPRTALLVASLLALPAGAGRAWAKGEIFTAVYSTTFSGYVRAKQPDGTPKLETYVFGQGKFMTGRMRDPSIDGYAFLNLARLLAPYLARQNYLPTRSPDQTDLLIVVHWGTTIPYDDGTYRDAVDALSTAMSASGDASGALQGDITGQLMMMQMENRQRQIADAHNAALLGYLPEMDRLGDLARLAGFGSFYQDLVSEVEEDRYFVILAAYDYHAARYEKKRKLLWITRVSISARGNRFDEQLAAMIASATPYFGRDTPKLMRGFTPEGKVQVGEPKVIEFLPPSPPHP